MEVTALRASVTRRLPSWVKRPAKRLLRGEHVRYLTTFSDRQWLDFLGTEVRVALERGDSTIVILHDPSQDREALVALLRQLNGVPVAAVEASPSQSDGVSIRALLPPDLAERQPPAQLAFVACSTRNSDVQGWLGLVLADPEYRDSNFIFKIRPADSNGAIAKNDRADGITYVSSAFDDDIIRDVYLASLSKVEPKYDVRDAYDLYQALISTRQVPGAICEFGSYRGHSGLILSEAMRRLDMHKPVYLCDTFEEFPKEEMAIDKFWNDSHSVDYASVQRLFEAYDFVTLIKGDFTATIPTLPVEQLSLVHVDCDSYRAVQLVSEFAFPLLAPGGVMVYEDYGHDFCLGARAAVDDFYQGRNDCFRFFSGYSGLELVVKH